MTSMDKPTVFVFSTAYHPFVGGAEIAIQEIAKRLKDQFRFFIITARIRRDLPRVEEREEGIVIRVGFGTRFDKFLVPLWGTVITFRLMRRARPVLFWPVMVTFASGIPYIVNILRFWDRIPILLTLQEGDSEAHIRARRLGFIQLSWHLALRRTDSLHTISRYLADLAVRYGWRGPTDVIPNGVNIEQFGRDYSADEKMAVRRELGVRPDETIIITTSRLAEKNAVDVLIRACGEVVAGNPDWKLRLVIVGDGEKRPGLEQLAERLGLSERVMFAGAVPYTLIPRYLSIADIYCRPSRSEGLGSAFLEAMAAGIPVIATPVGGIPDFLRDGENGLFVRVDDPSDLARKIQTLLLNRDLRSGLIANAKGTIAERYQWDDIAAAFQNLFQKLIERRARPRILIATPIFPPAIGGPATYAKNLAEQLSARGFPVSVLTYGAATGSGPGISVRRVSSRIPSGLKHFVYFFKAFQMLSRSDVVLAFDPFIVGVPVACARFLRRTPMLVRVEGDFLWETYAERTRRDLTLAGFYRALPRLDTAMKERLVYALSRFVFRSAERLVFSSQWRADIFKKGYGRKSNQACMISSPWPNGVRSAKTRESVVLFAGRLVWVKNLPRLIQAFLAVAPRGWKLEIIGDGPMRRDLERIIRDGHRGEKIVIRSSLSRHALLERITSVRAFVLPSLSEVSPNVILDCIMTGTPFILTRETGFYEMLKDVGLFIDPLNLHDLELKLQQLVNPKDYTEYHDRLLRFHETHTWDEVANAWIALISDML